MIVCILLFSCANGRLDQLIDVMSELNSSEDPTALAMHTAHAFVKVISCRRMQFCWGQGLVLNKREDWW
jgi:hypothetical protein